MLALAAIPRLLAATQDHGMVWPDEIFQTLEPAHAFLFGYGIEAWEFSVGARSWLLPGVVVVVWKLLSLLGVDSALGLITGAKLVMAALSLLGVYGAMRLAQALAGRDAALMTGLLMAAFPLSLYFSARCIGDDLAGTVLVLAALAQLDAERRRPLLSGALCGLAVFLKYQAGIVLLALLVYVALARPREELRRWLIGALSVGLLGGLLDWATWGVPFHAIRTYLEYNILFDQSAKYGVEGPAAYARWAWTATGPALAAVAMGLALGARRAAIPLLIALPFLLAHLAIPHKEIRFLLPVVPLLLVVAGTGLALALARVRAPAMSAGALGALLAALMARHAAAASYADLGLFARYDAGRLPVWGANAGLNRLLALAGEQADACGVWVAGIRVPFTGGYAYLHRDVPMLWGALPYNAYFANYVLMPLAPVPFPMSADPSDTLQQPPRGYAAVARNGGWALYVRAGTCQVLPPELDVRRIYG